MWIVLPEMVQLSPAPTEKLTPRPGLAGAGGRAALRHLCGRVVVRVPSLVVLDGARAAAARHRERCAGVRARTAAAEGHRVAGPAPCRSHREARTVGRARRCLRR